MNFSLIYPMFAMVLLTMIVAVCTFLARRRAVRDRKVPVSYFHTFTGAVPPEDVLKTGRHFVNLFEVPVLFYAGCLVAMVFPLNTPTVSFWAWLFVAMRIAHAWIHMGSNRIYPRMLVFAGGLVAVLGLWLTIVIAQVMRPQIF